MSEQVTTPPPAGDPTIPPAPPAVEPAPPAKSGAGKRIRNVVLRFVLVPALVLIGALVWKVASGDPELANTGDCLIGQSADDIKIVGCDDATAEWKVVGKVGGVRDADFSATTDTSCDAYATAEASFWSGTKGGKGDVLCLEPLKK